MAGYNYIKWFNEIGKDDISQVGGKGANLGELTSMGLPVPPGFCVTAGAYDEFINYSELDEIVRILVSSLDVEDVEALTDASKEVRDKINSSEIKA